MNTYADRDEPTIPDAQEPLDAELNAIRKMVTILNHFDAGEQSRIIHWLSSWLNDGNWER